MPCTAGSNCNIQGDTPGPPDYTCHKCRVCSGYLHGICGVVDPLGASEMKRLCKLCMSPTKRKASGPPAGDDKASKRHDTKNEGKEKVLPNRSTEKTTSYKPRGADSRKRLSFAEKVEALTLLKTMKGTAVAQKFGIGHSTLYKLKKEATTIVEKAQTLKPDAKSTRGAKYVEAPERREEVVFPDLPDCPRCSSPATTQELEDWGMCSQCKADAISAATSVPPGASTAPARYDLDSLQGDASWGYQGKRSRDAWKNQNPPPRRGANRGSKNRNGGKDITSGSKDEHGEDVGGGNSHDYEDFSVKMAGLVKEVEELRARLAESEENQANMVLLVKRLEDQVKEFISAVRGSAVTAESAESTSSGSVDMVEPLADLGGRVVAGSG
ncbi:unnamed protein product, partial [Choristocarpus tenellus]